MVDEEIDKYTKLSGLSISNKLPKNEDDFKIQEQSKSPVNTILNA